MLISILFIFIIGYHILMYFTKDKKLIQRILNNPDPIPVDLFELKDFPLIYIVIPAWNERMDFLKCLQSIGRITYPKLHIIINAGGHHITEDIANLYKKDSNFTVLKQIGGSDNAATGKIKALNECLPYIKEGIIWFIDADCYLTDDLLYRMLTPIIRLKEQVVSGAGLEPLPRQKGDFIDYLRFSRFGYHKNIFNRYYTNYISGANTMMTYEVIKKIGKFTENRRIAEDTSRGIDINNKGFKIYALSNSNSKIMTKYPNSIKEHLKQRHVYMKNALLSYIKKREYKQLIKMILSVLISLYILIFPIFIFINIKLFLIGMFILLSYYYKRIRILLNYNKINNEKIKIKFFRIFIYSYIDIIGKII